MFYTLSQKVSVRLSTIQGEIISKVCNCTKKSTNFCLLKVHKVLHHVSYRNILSKQTRCINMIVSRYRRHIHMKHLATCNLTLLQLYIFRQCCEFIQHDLIKRSIYICSYQCINKTLCLCIGQRLNISSIFHLSKRCILKIKRYFNTVYPK